MNIEYADDLKSIEIFPPGKTFRLTYEPAVGMMRLISKARGQLDEIRQYFSVENKSAFFSQQYGYKGEPRLYNVNAFGYFNTGLVYSVLEWIKLQYGGLNQVAISEKCAKCIKDMTKPLLGKIPDNFEIMNMSSGMQMRDYQKAAARALIFDGLGCGMIEIPTAGGKSFILANVIWNVKRILGRLKTLILVPNVQLVEQFYKDLREYGYAGEQLARFEGGMTKKERQKNDIAKAEIIIANRQYLFKNRRLLPELDLLICDEVHTANSESTSDFIVKSGAKMKIGCSGTIPADKYLQNRLVGMFGKIVYREEISDLQGQGYITKLKITSISVIDKSVEADRSLLFNMNSTRKYDADDAESDLKFNDAVIAEREYTARWYKDLYRPVLQYVGKLDGNTLVLFDKIDIGTSLYGYFAEMHPGRSVFYNDGKTDVRDRENTRSGFEASEHNVLFANVQILSTGVSIKRLHNIVFCFGSKSTTRVIQSIGRALRLYGDKDFANLIDVHFNFKYSSRHYAERLKMYREFYKKNKPDEQLTFDV